jgi:hypothetical protein
VPGRPVSRSTVSNVAAASGNEPSAVRSNTVRTQSMYSGSAPAAVIAPKNSPGCLASYVQVRPVTSESKPATSPTVAASVPNP